MYVLNGPLDMYAWICGGKGTKLHFINKEKAHFFVSGMGPEELYPRRPLEKSMSISPSTDSDRLTRI